jgi:hypothetical protein
MDIIIDFDDDDPSGFKTIKWDDQPEEPLAGDDREENEQVPTATPAAEKTWHEIIAELFTSFFHEDKNEFLKLRTLDLNPQHQHLFDHVASCDECRAAVESAEAKRKARL